MTAGSGRVLLLLLAMCGPGLADEFDLRGYYDKAEHRVAMRDGIELHTAVYRPKDRSKRYPFLLLRTPYSIEPYGEQAFPDAQDIAPGEAFLRAGYIFVLQDARGTHRSGGKWVDLRPLREDRRSAGIDESTDTYDTIEWLLRNIAEHNGRVGQWGFSYPGWYAVQGLVGSHPALRAVSPQATTGDAFIGDDYHLNGAFALTNNVPFMDKLAVVTAPDRGERTWGTIKRRLNFNQLWDYGFFLESGPLAGFNAKYYGGRLGPAWDDLVAHSSYDQYWQRRNPAKHLANVAVPVLNVGGWFDGYCPYGTVSTYYAIEKLNSRNRSTLVMGPWHHGGWMEEHEPGPGDFLSGSVAAAHYRESIVFPFFQHHLKDEGNWKAAEAIVFETGGERWHRLESWPPRNVAGRSLFLRADAALSFESPAGAQPDAHDTYVSDPARPVPIAADMNSSDDEDMTADQRYAATRPDVLTYRTEALQEPVTVAGPILAKLFVSTSGTDSDWIVKLIDVFPGEEPDRNGVNLRNYQMLVAVQLMRGRFRKGLSAPQPMQPGVMTPIELTLWDRFHTFRKGHRLMVQIQSSLFPKYDRNPQTYVDIATATGDDYRKATQSVYRSSQAASHLMLPVVEGPLAELAP